jgi:hypothetical protein
VELVTEPLTRERLRSEFLQVVEWLKQRDIQDLSVLHGYGANLPMDEVYKPHLVKTEELLAFVEHCIGSGAFAFGESDLHIDSGKSMTFAAFTFCHESDLHVESDDAAFIEQLKVAWTAKGIQWYEINKDRPRDQYPTK